VVDASVTRPAIGGGSGADDAREAADAPPTWTRGGMLVIPAPIDLDASLDRDPEVDDGEGETLASLGAAAARGGFATVCVRGTPAGAAQGAAGAAEGSPVRILGAPGERLASVPATGALLATILRAAAAGRTVVAVADDASSSAGAEAGEGLVATVLGLRAVPDAAEVAAVERAIEALRRAVAVSPSSAPPRLHLSRVSLAASVERIRAAKAEGLPLTADASAHHLVIHDGWIGGDRRFAWDAASRPWTGPATADAYDARHRARPPFRSPADALALGRGVDDGTIDAFVSGHEPRRPWQVLVEFGDAAPGGSTIETTLAALLEAARARVVTLGRAIAALTVGPSGVLGEQHRGIVPGRPAFLTVIDPTRAWTPGPETLRAAAAVDAPLAGVGLRGRVVATIVKGRVAYVDPSIAA
jgi:dihydroorotase